MNKPISDKLRSRLFFKLKLLGLVAVLLFLLSFLGLAIVVFIPIAAAIVFMLLLFFELKCLYDDLMIREIGIDQNVTDHNLYAFDWCVYISNLVLNLIFLSSLVSFFNHYVLPINQDIYGSFVHIYESRELYITHIPVLVLLFLHICNSLFETFPALSSIYKRIVFGSLFGIMMFVIGYVYTQVRIKIDIEIPFCRSKVYIREEAQKSDSDCSPIVGGENRPTCLKDTINQGGLDIVRHMAFVGYPCEGRSCNKGKITIYGGDTLEDSMFILEEKYFDEMCVLD